MARLVLPIVLIIALSSVNAKEYKNTKEAMDDIFSAFVELLPYASNEMRFKDPKAEGFIKDRLLKLKTAFKKAKHLKEINTPGFKPSFDAVSRHLDQTYDGFEMSQKSFARNRLKATAEMCISCHTQLPKGISHTFNSLSKVKRQNFNNDYEYADYLFLVRNYTQASHYYREEIKNRISKNQKLKKIHDDNNASYIDFTIEKSLERLLTIHTKVFYRPKKALATVQELMKQDGLAQNFKKEMKDWEEDLKVWEKRKVTELRNEKDVRAFISQYLEQDINQVTSHVDLLIASGFLYRYLNKYAKTSAQAEILYTLGAIDDVLNHSYFYSLAEIYLKRCVVKFPKSPYAKKCYKRYKDRVEFGYTGTAGTSIPESEAKELARLKKILSNAK